MTTSSMHRPFLVRREPVRPGIHLVPPASKRTERTENPVSEQPSGLYKIAAVGAALLLVFTTC